MAGLSGTTLLSFYVPMQGTKGRSTIHLFADPFSKERPDPALTLLSASQTSGSDWVAVGLGDNSPCLDSTVTGIPGSLSLMNGPISLSMPSRARRRFLVHTFPWTRSLSSYKTKGTSDKAPVFPLCTPYFHPWPLRSSLPTPSTAMLYSLAFVTMICIT